MFDNENRRTSIRFPFHHPCQIKLLKDNTYHNVKCNNLGLKGMEMSRSQCQTIRLKLLKIGAQIRITVRKVWISLSEGYPYADLFTQVYENLSTA